MGPPGTGPMPAGPGASVRARLTSENGLAKRTRLLSVQIGGLGAAVLHMQ